MEKSSLPVQALSADEAARYIGLKNRRALDYLGARGPRPIRLSPRCRVYSIAELDRWLAAQNSPEQGV